MGVGDHLQAGDAVRLRTYQEETISNTREQLREGRHSVLIVCPTGGGKCLGPTVPVLKANGEIVEAQTLQPGDRLVGDDGAKRTVQSVTRGRGPMFRVVPVRGEPFTCNDAHVLTLVHTTTGEVIDLSLSEYLQQSRTFKHLHKLFSVGVGRFDDEQYLSRVSPYFFGLWLADGTKALKSVSISKPDPEVLAACHEEARRHGLHVRSEPTIGCVTHHLVGSRNKPNPLLNEIRRLWFAGRLDPSLWRLSWNQRCELLAGVLDGDGHRYNGCFEIAQKSKTLADFIAFTARSLGLRVLMAEKLVNGVVYHRMTIAGDATHLPLRIERKKPTRRRQIKDAQRTGFTIEPLGEGDYFGFEIDGNGRFLLGNFMVTHNTVIGSEIIRGAVLRDTRTLFLAHRRELIDQTSEKLGRFGVPHGVIMGAKRMALQQPVQVASVQTVINRVAVLPRFKLIMVDEAHHVTEGNTYAKLLKAWPEARIIGLTATPWRLDGIGLGDVFDGHILVRTPKQLRDEGYLVPVCGSEYEAPKTAGVAVRGGDFQASDLDAAVRSKTLYGNIVKEWMADAGNVRTIVFCVSVAHAKELAQAFVDAGVRAESVDAKTPKEARAATLARLRSGETRVVCNVAVLTEGFDCPAVSCVVLARPTLSTSLYLQMVGRALRPVCLNCDEAVQWTVSHCPKCGSANIKRSARIHDHAGCSKAHGHPYSDRDFSPGASLEQVRSMTARQITDSWGNADPKTAGQSPLTPLLVKMVEDVKKTAIGGDGRPMTQAQKTDELKRQREWRAKSWTDKQAIWERLCLKHGSAKAKGVFRFMSGFTDFVPQGWLRAAQQREKTGLATTAAPTEPEGEVI